jgi:hypothetical protein
MLHKIYLLLFLDKVNQLHYSVLKFGVEPTKELSLVEEINIAIFNYIKDRVWKHIYNYFQCIIKSVISSVLLNQW